MKLFNYLLVASAIFCVTPVQSDSTVVDFTGGAIKGTATNITITATPTSCTSGVWTCTFASSSDVSVTYRTIEDVAVAHINKDGSIYLQEIDVDKYDNDNWSVELPAWYVSNGLTSYSLIGTDCKFTITPVFSNGTVTNWTMTTKKTRKNSTKHANTEVSTCGGNDDEHARTGKSGKEKTSTSAKGPKAK